MRKKLEFKVPDDCNNMLARRFLRGRCGLSARIITRLTREKDGILMDGKILRTVDFVTAGKTVVISLPDESTDIEPAKGELDIVFEDDFLLVVNKPCHMPVHPVKQHQTDTLANIVACRCKESGDDFVFRAVNRLDKDTSGLVVIAKNKFFANALKNNVHKKYYAVCEGSITEEGTINAPIGLRDDSKIVRTVRSDGAPSVTHYKPVYTGRDYSLVELWLETGRTHQIRCHMSYLGHPLAGDDLYGGGLDKITRQALHCREVSFTHPVTKESVTLSAKIPDDMQSLIISETEHNKKED